MGVHAPEASLPAGLDPRIIDYTGRVRSELDDPDFADAYLQATCKFFLGTGSGIYILSSMFGRPVAYANMLPYGECGRLPHDIVIFKNSRDVNTGNLIPYGEMISRGVDSDWLTEEEISLLEAQGIEFVDNTSDDIRNLVLEMNERLDGTWKANPEDKQLQEQFVKISPARHFNSNEFPGRVGAAFLRKNRLLLT